MADVLLPDPRNQFHRLYKSNGIWVKGTRWDTVHDSANCCAAAGATALDVLSENRIKATPPQIRNSQDDKIGGIGLDDVQRAHAHLARQFGITIPVLMMPRGITWSEVIVFLKEGRLVMGQGDHGYLPLAERCQSNYTGDHAFILNRYRASDSRVQLYDSLCTNPKWVTQAGIRAAMEMLAIRLRGSRGELFVGVTQRRSLVAAPSFPVTVYPGAVQRGRGSFRIKKSGVALRSRPSTADSAIIKNTLLGQTFRAAQSLLNGPAVLGNREWKGTADGRCWIPEAYLSYVGPYTNRETYR